MADTLRPAPDPDGFPPGFSPLVRDWFAAALGTPTPVQLGTWDAVARGDHVLALAPTGSGKTLAAFLVAIDRLIRRGRDDREGMPRVVYVSPLKALVNDVARNLGAPLRAIEELARSNGTETVPVRVAVRTGDTPASDRRRFAAHGADILVTTPESLYLLLTSKAADRLGRVDTVIVDEVHALADTKRGAHLALSLERLDARLARPAQRIGLSATVAPVDAVADFLAGPAGAGRVTIVHPPSSRTPSVRVVSPVADLSAPDLVGGEPREGGVWPAVVRLVADLVAEHRSTLVFVNARQQAERLTAGVNALAGPGAPRARAHHGSVSQQARREIEADLKSGALRAVVATSSLELGIDMGEVDLVVLVGSPPSVAAGIQRIGRSGHRVGGHPDGIIVPLHRADALHAAVVAEHIRSGAIEPLRPVRGALDVLAQQIVAETALRPRAREELARLVRGAAPYRDLPDAALGSVLDMLTGRYPSQHFSDLRPRLDEDPRTGVLRARRGAQRLAVTSGGAIPDRGLYPVTRTSADPAAPGRGGGRIGELDEEMVNESRVGDVILLGTASWRLESITPERVTVSPAPAGSGSLPFWHGDDPGRPAALGRAIGVLTRELLDATAPARHARLRAAGLDEASCRTVTGLLDEQLSATGRWPDDRTLVAEQFRDELGDWRLVLHCPLGDRVNTPLALLLGRELARITGTRPAMSHTDDGLALQWPGEGGPADALVPVLRGLAALDVTEALREELGATALFGSRFREAAARSLLLPRRLPGHRTPLWQQRLRAARLLEVAGRHGDFALVLEAYRECLQDRFDLAALRRLLVGLATGDVAVHVAETAWPSPLAREQNFSYTATHLYASDAPAAERQSSWLRLDPGLLEGLLGSDRFSELVDPATITELEHELQGLDADSAPRDEDGLWDLLRRVGPQSPAALDARGVPRAWADRLAAAGRIEPVTVDRAGTTQTLWRDPGDRELSTRDLVHRFARCHGPFGATAAARDLGLPPGEVAAALRGLARAGDLVGSPGPSATGPDMWCDPEVLTRLRRRTLARLRRRVSPVDPAALVEFLPEWQGAAGLAAEPPDDPGPGDEALREALDPLLGWPAGWRGWQQVLLPARLPGFRTRDLDALLRSGRLLWQVTAVHRDDLTIRFLDPSEAEGRWPRTVPGADSAPSGPDARPREALSAALFEALGSEGATAQELAEKLDEPVAQVRAGLLDLAGRGLATADSLAPLGDLTRPGLVGARTAAAPPAARRGRRRPPRPARTAPFDALGRSGDSVRWRSVVAGTDPEERVDQLLTRWGVVGRATTAEDLPGGFSALYPVLRRWEDQGTVWRGAFLAGLGGAQFATSEAIDLLRDTAAALDRPAPGEAGHRVLGAADPAQPFGAALPWPAAPAGVRPTRRDGALVISSRGRLEAFVDCGAGRLALWPEGLTGLAGLAVALARAVRRGAGGRGVTLRTVNGVSLGAREAPAPETRAALVAAGFATLPSGLRLHAGE